VNILQVTSHLFIRAFGGEPAKEIFGLSKALADRGHNVTICTTNMLNKSPKVTSPDLSITNIKGVQVYEFNSWGLGLGPRMAVSPGVISMMSKQTAQFDIIHLNQYPTFLNVIAHHYARKYDVPYLLQAHGSLPGVTSSYALRRVFDVLWGRMILREADKVVAVSNMESEQYRHAGIAGNKISVVPNAIDISEFEDLPAKGEFREAYNLKNDQRLILYLGRINKIKGLDLLVKAYADEQLAGEAKLVIAGPDDGYLSTLKGLIAELKISDDNILFTGPLHGRAKLAAYVDADVYVLPSIYEIFGVTILEACACGTPVVVTDRCGIADIVHEQVGLAVPFDKNRLREALLYILREDKIRHEFGARGKVLVREKFTWPRVAEQVESLYKVVRH
jgi:glycosyltransferase involved in cell wall biosynthesis